MPKIQVEKRIGIEVSLAPMYGVTDFVTRLFLHLLSSPGKMTTPFLRVTDSYPHKVPLDWAPDVFDEAVKEKLSYEARLQMMASCPKRFAEAFFMFESFLEDVELNCGCPSPKVVSHAAGSSLLKEPKVFSCFVSEIAERIGEERFCVKMRTGYEDTEDFDRLIAGISHLNLKQLTIHGRTKAQKYTLFSRNDLIHRASKSLSYPVMASGDVVDRTSFKKALSDMPLIKGVMIGRGSLTNPFLFQELQNPSFEKPGDLSFLKEALLCYGLLVEISKNDFPGLRELILSSDFERSYLSEKEKWSSLFKELYERVFQKKFEGSFDGELGVATLGRVKLLFANFVKGFFPKGSGKPVLRAKSAETLFLELEKFFGESC